MRPVLGLSWFLRLLCCEKYLGGGREAGELIPLSVVVRIGNLAN